MPEFIKKSKAIITCPANKVPSNSTVGIVVSINMRVNEVLGIDLRVRKHLVHRVTDVLMKVRRCSLFSSHRLPHAPEPILISHRLYVKMIEKNTFSMFLVQGFPTFLFMVTFWTLTMLCSTDLAAGAAVAPHGFTARVSCGSNYL